VPRPFLHSQYLPRGHWSRASPGQAARVMIGVAFCSSVLSRAALVCAPADSAERPSTSAPALSVIACFRIGVSVGYVDSRGGTDVIEA
jgi:hypothetical protein